MAILGDRLLHKLDALNVHLCEDITTSDKTIHSRKTVIETTGNIFIAEYMLNKKRSIYVFVKSSHTFMTCVSHIYDMSQSFSCFPVISVDTLVTQQ